MEKAKTNLGKAVIITAAALVIALPLRVYQLMNVIKTDGSGFYQNNSNPTIYILYGVCLLQVIFAFVFSLKGRKITLYSSPQGKNKAIAFSALFFALTLVMDAVVQSVNAFGLLTGRIEVSKLITGDTFGASSKYFLMLQAVFALLSAVYFVFVSVTYFTEKVNYREKTVLAVSPVLWGICRLMLRFMKTVTYRYVSELLFELFMIVLCLLFFMAFIRLAADANVEKPQFKLFGYGLAGAFFCFLSSVPRYIVALIGSTNVLYAQQSLYQVCDLAMGIFIMCVIFGVMRETQYKAVEEFTV